MKFLQKQLWETIKGDPDTRHLSVLAPSFANLKDNTAKVGDLSEWLDYGNIHPYAAGSHPSKHWGRGMLEEESISKARIISGNKPIISTEGGYHNRIEDTGHPRVTEYVDAVYSLHLLFEYFNAGMVRTYLYEFLDNKPDPDFTDKEYHFGMIRADGTPKPVYHAVKNLISILKDDTELLNPRPLAYRITSDSLPDNEVIKQTLLQKNDGSWWISLYRTASIFDLRNKVEVECTPVSIKLELDRSTDNLQLFRPNESDMPLTTFHNIHEITFELDEKLILIKIEPS